MTGQGPLFLWVPPPLSHGCLSPPQSSILDLADIFAPTPAPPSTHCSADPWDIPGGHAGLQEPPRLASESPFLPGHLLTPLPLHRSGPLVKSLMSLSLSSEPKSHGKRSQKCAFVTPVTLAFLPQSIPDWEGSLSCPC